MHTVVYTELTEKQQRNRDWAKRLGIGLGITIGAGIAANNLGSGASWLVEKALKRGVTGSARSIQKLRETAKTLYPKMTKTPPVFKNSLLIDPAANAGITFDRRSTAFMRKKVGEAIWAGPGTAKEKREILAAHKPFFHAGVHLSPGAKIPVVAHELGHSVKDFYPRNPKFRKVRFLGRMVKNVSGSPIAVASLAAHPAIELTNWSPETKRRAHQAAIALPLLGGAPLVGGEFMASYRGARILRKAGMLNTRRATTLGTAVGAHALPFLSTSAISAASAVPWKPSYKLRKEPTR